MASTTRMESPAPDSIQRPHGMIRGGGARYRVLRLLQLPRQP
ncbi:hypothetical protein ACFVQ0_09440 [Streptomyces sp. NPDC057900]